MTVSRSSLKRQGTSEEPSGKLGKVKRNRQASVYDAVAGSLSPNEEQVKTLEQ